ncbi:MAG: M3 family metallopeptidase [Bdellovibrio sp.]
MNKYFSGQNSLFDQAAPFDELTPPLLEQSWDEALVETRLKLQALRQSSETDFSSVSEALECLMDSALQVASIVGTLYSSCKSPEIEKLHARMSPELAQLSNEVLLDPMVFKKIEALHQNLESQSLSPEQEKLLREQYKNFVRNGARLGERDKETLRSLDEKLARRTPEFSKNILEATHAIEIPVASELELKGLPPLFIEEARANARNRQSPSPFLLNLQGPLLMAVLTFCENRELRQKLWLSYQRRCVHGEWSNLENVREILKLRHQRARLLGFGNHAKFVLEDRMAQTPEKAMNLLQQLKKAARDKAMNELEEVRQLARQHSGIELEAWDFAFFSEKIKNQRFSLSEQVLREYFPMDQVIHGLFTHAQKIFGMSFIERADLPLFHPDMKAFEVQRGEQFTGILYLDLYPRENKQAGAWANPFRDGGLWQGSLRHPHVLISCNFTKPQKDSPSLLNLQEVVTLFHEFGHASHALLSKCRYRSLAGTNVLWDFVELPSQIMENWCYEKETLRFLSRHWKTGETLPDSLVTAIRNSQNFQSGWHTLRQVRFALLDLKIHQLEPSELGDLLELERSLTHEETLFPPYEDVATLPSFSHIFAGGYSAGYYSYKWAEVLESDAFDLFKSQGVYNTKLGQDFAEKILAWGGSRHPSDLFRNFRGRDPDPTALLRKHDLLESKGGVSA